MLNGVDKNAVGGHRQKVVAMPARLKCHEQSVERQGSDSREGELRRREYWTGTARRERRNDQAECRQGGNGRKGRPGSLGVERDDRLTPSPDQD
jgi:hypothetical protein